MRVAPSLQKTAVAVTVSLVVGLPGAHAFQVRQERSRFDAIAVPDPSVVVSPAALATEAVQVPESVRGAWRSFQAENGDAWEVTIDARSGTPLLVQGRGIPFIPGSGNTLESAGLVTLDSLATSLRAFLAKNASLLKADDAELVLNREGSGQVTPDLWQVIFERSVAGLPVAGDSYVFHIGHGNLIAFGAPRWSPITTDATPVIDSKYARALLFTHMGLKDTDAVRVHDPGTLMFLPMAAAGGARDSFAGAVGTGYQTALAWRFALEVEGEPGKWVGMVDARTGAVLALYDAIAYAQAKGGVFPLTDDGICTDGCEQAGYPMPFADIKIGASSSSAGSMGSFTCSPGGSTATTKLAGQYVKVSDNCGAISQSVTCDADLDLKTSSGTDCTVPAGASVGDTHAARSSFYHLNRIKEHARAWLPSNTWLTQQLTDNVNINNSCNAFWNDGGVNGTVNFYRSGGGCRNTGEIAGVFLHEWGHGLDQNDGGSPPYDNPSEAYADITSFFLTHASCIGRGFVSSNCSGYGNACLSCTGVRDQDWNKHSSHAPQTPENWPGSCPSGAGPCGKEVHCEAYLTGETLWDLAVRDLPAAGIDPQTAWQIADRLWFKSRQGSGGNAYGCGSPAANRSCAAASWFTKFRTVDDDDGNLANGTPHAAAIFAAFSRHNIPCGASTDATNQSTSACPSLAAPTLTATGGPNQIALSWTSVAGASSYNVLRNDQGCGWGLTIVANVAGTTYTDTGLPNGFPLYYSIQALGSNTSCLGTLSTCTTAQASGAATADLAVAKSGSPGTVPTGQDITYTVTVTNNGPSAASSAQLSDATPVNTTFQSIVAAGWGCSTPSVGGTGTITCTAASFNTSSPATFTIVVRVNYCAGNGTVITNTASVSSSTSDPNSGNNSASATTTVSDTGACNDGDACTQTDGCQGATCVGSNPVVCTASDQCHDAGTCNPATGQCSNPAKPNGASCNDGDACTQTDTCQAGTCAGSNPVVCTASDQCHDAGTCNPATGQCSNPAKPNGASCSDGDACTQTDTCQAGTCTGSNPVTCTALDACHVAGTCNPSTGQCSNPDGPNGTSCSDGDACTQSDSCQGGACVGSNPVVCTASDQCHDAGTCNPATGQCSNPAKADGTACNDGNECTRKDACQSGACTSSSPVVCTASDPCHVAGTCDAGTGQCSNPAAPDGTACSDGNACTTKDACASGQCRGGAPLLCDDANVCTDDSCDPASGCVHVNNTNPCDDGNLCTGWAAGNDHCADGVCIPGAPVPCSDGNPCTDDTCDPALGCMYAVNTAPCDDGNACTANDTCSGGQCAGTPVGPPAEVSNHRFASKTLEQWDPIGGGGPAPVYDVVRGLVGEWPVGNGPSEHCQASGIDVTETETDPTDAPAAPGAFWYLVRGRNACGTGTYGAASDGTPRTTSACP